MRELWKTIDEFPRYEISNMGDVRDTKTGRHMTRTLVQKGIPTVGLVKDHKVNRKSVPLLAATMWVPNHKNPPFDTPIQLDGNRLNCRADNLMWRPRWFAVQYHREKLMDEKLPNVRIMLLETGEIFSSVREASMAYGYLEQDIIDSINVELSVWPDDVHFDTTTIYID